MPATATVLPVLGVDFTFWGYDKLAVCAAPTSANTTDAPKGLGEVFAYAHPCDPDGKLYWWAYRTPRGLVVPIQTRGAYGAVKPPLPQKHPQQCGCRATAHTCTQCGEPFWIELHGCADGYCSYCYHRG